MSKPLHKKEMGEHVTMNDAYNSFEKGLTSYAFFKTNSHSMSNDLVQDTFVKTWAYLVKNGEIESMKAFLYHVLNHLIVDEYRKHKATSLDLLLEKGFEPHDTTDNERMHNVIDGKTAILLIANLPFAYQKVMHMRFVQELSLQEISSITGQTKNAVAVQTHRGLEKLKILYHKNAQ